MKVSRSWLGKYFDRELPNTAALAEALTFHAFEIESFDEDMLDVKVLPDRACYALSHRGIAYELSAILGIPMAFDEYQEPPKTFQKTDRLSVTGDESYVIRHTGALMKDVKVEPSPEWLQNALAAVGQRSINNVVDAMNYVMFTMGQPSGAFDLAKLKETEGKYAISIRRAQHGERITVLTGEEHTLTDAMFVFTDAISGELLDIAGIKGGRSTGVTEATTDIFLSLGNYDATLLRRVSQSLRLFTDSSLRFQNRVPPELTAYGMQHLVELIQKVAGGELIGVVDFYPEPVASRTFSVSLRDVNARLGSSFNERDMEDALTRLMLPYEKKEDAYSITPPFYRRDLTISEDIVEEVGRIVGYDHIVGTPFLETKLGDVSRAYGIERVKDFLVERGFTEISTPSFAADGDVLLANPLQTERPYLRRTLSGNMREALTRAALTAPRVLGPATCVRLFEIGTVFQKGGERLSLSLGHKEITGKVHNAYNDAVAAVGELLNVNPVIEQGIAELPLGEVDLEKLGEGYVPRAAALSRFRPFSQYPFALRDVAVWTPLKTEETEVANVIAGEAGEFLARMDLFDRYEKEGRISYAFRLVFESFEKTLSDEELVPLMEKVHTALTKRGWDVR